MKPYEKGLLDAAEVQPDLEAYTERHKGADKAAPEENDSVDRAMQVHARIPATTGHCVHQEPRSWCTWQ